MAEYTNDHVEIEDLPEGIQVDGIGDTLPEGGDGIKVPLMENGEPYPAHVPPEDPETHNPDYSDTGAEDDDDPYDDCDWNDDDDDGGGEEGSSNWYDDWDWNDDEGEEGSSDWDDNEATKSDSPRDRFSEFAGVSAALLGDALRSVLSVESIQQLEFGTQSGDVWAYFSIKIGK